MMVLTIMQKFMRPYNIMMSESFFASEAELRKYYVPKKTAMQTVDDKTFGNNSFFGCCFFVLDRLRTIYQAKKD